MSDGNSQNHCQERKMSGGKLCSHWLLGKNVSIFVKGFTISDIFISMKWANCHRRFTIFDIIKDICRLSQDVHYISHKK